MAKQMKSGGGDGSSTPWASGSDAAYIKPKLVPDYELLPRDDSGGPDYDAYNMQFGDGGFVTGEKKHLSAKGGKDDDERQDEVSEEPRAKDANRAGGDKNVAPEGPSRSKRYSRE